MDTEKFDWFINMIESGETININPMIYGDFLRYVEHVGKARVFQERMFSEKVDTGEPDWDSIVIRVGFH